MDTVSPQTKPSDQKVSLEALRQLVQQQQAEIEHLRQDLKAALNAYRELLRRQ